jgi:hypothetical protein
MHGCIHAPEQLPNLIKNTLAGTKSQSATFPENGFKKPYLSVYRLPGLTSNAWILTHLT